MIKTVEWTDDGVIMVDQRRLPTEELYPIFRTYQEIAVAIKEMVVRGAPAIGVTAAMGVARGLLDSKASTVAELEADLTEISRVIGATRPTAVNLFWAIERMRVVFNNQKTEGATVDEIKRRLVDEAKAVYQEDLASGEQLGLLGGELIPDNATVLTHCNAGALATAGGYGTALGVIRGAVALGKKIQVFADETRPFLQGARLTAWELMKDDIPVTLITDNMSGHFMKAGKIDCIVVGADRIAANGDTANKIGTYMVAVLAREHNIPFYVAAPISTLDLAIPSGEHIPIEDRTITEVTHIKGQQVAPTGVMVANPAFDVTPHRFIAAIITDRGVARPPYTETLQALMRS